MLEWNQAETRVPETVLHPFTNRKERQRALDIFLQVTATKGRDWKTNQAVGCANSRKELLSAKDHRGYLVNLSRLVFVQENCLFWHKIEPIFINLVFNVMR